MRILRLLMFAFILAAAFFYFTTYRNGLRPASYLSRPQHLEVTEAASGESLDAEEQNNITVYRRNIASVVNITSVALAFDFFQGLVPQKGQGSGFIIDKEGHILTNFHVIEGARQVEVSLHGRKRPISAEVIGTDQLHDLAVLKISAQGLQPMTLGDSASLQVGQKVYAIGNPFGFSGTLTRGIVSSIRGVREPDGMEIEDAIQTDAAINPGNSGGPLLNWHGEVIGINTMIASNAGQSAGIGFAIPINTAKAVLNDLVTLGRVRRPALGIRTIPIDPGLANELELPADYGLLIVQAVPGLAADRAGLRGGNKRVPLSDNITILGGGDLIVGIDGEKIENQQDLAQVMNKHRAGDTVRVEIYRGKKKMELSVVLGEAREQV